MPSILDVSFICLLYIILDNPHRGKFGVVFKGICKKTREEVAIKVMLKKGNKKGDVEREVDVLKKLKHPNVLGFHDYQECGAEFVLVMEM